ncbi:heat shock factor protein-like isoform X2 [Ctenocephalides felis]|uniref:heat shock factor protein-like isoform X2 n=1 Tax=Ctenocephalides felis TaxID=7515 RepID=UPI000E6E17E6|nr:heat shock factor protein-like isoform X2 [Ctenocephalides felis]
MHSVTEFGSTVPAFLGKLWRLVEDPETDHLISWSSDGLSFVIRNQAQFARELLPLNYKHNNMASFIRQLNMYGFHKVASAETGSLKFDKDEIEFSHMCFLKGHPYLLEHIKRKVTNVKSLESKSISNIEEVSRVLNEVKSMKGRQESLDARFSAMKQENKALWREVAVLRQKHLKQQQIVNKLIQFLVSIVTPGRAAHLPSMSMGVKRPFQLMLGDSPNPAKIAKTSSNNVTIAKKPTTTNGPTIHELATESSGNELAVELEDCVEDEEYVLGPCTSQPIIASPRSTGQPSPNHLEDVIPVQFVQNAPSDEVQHFVAEEIDPLELLNVNSIASASSGKSATNTNNDEDTTSKLLLFDKNKKYTSVNEDLVVPDIIFEDQNIREQTVENLDPLVSGGIKLDSGNNNNQSLVKRKMSKENLTNDMALATVSSASHKTLDRLNSKDDVDQHLENVQGELESLRDLLKEEGYLDANALLGLFGSDDPLSYGITMNPSDLTEDDCARLRNYNENAGLELMTYSGMQPDLVDLNEMWVNQELESDVEKDLPKTAEELHTPQVGLSLAPFEK